MGSAAWRRRPWSPWSLVRPVVAAAALVTLTATTTLAGAASAQASGVRHGTGLIPSSHRVAPAEGLRRVFGSHARRELPAAINLSAWDVPVGDQGAVNSCEAWTVAYGMAGWFDRHDRGGGGAPFAPMYTYSQISARSGGDNGSSAADNFAILADQGVDSRRDYPQGDQDWEDPPTQDQIAAAAPNRTPPGYYLYEAYPGSGGPDSRTTIEASLAEGLPLSLGIPVFSTFYGVDSLAPYSDSDADGADFVGLHAVLVVGYSDVGVLVQNSWGTGWGAGGYAVLGWDFVEDHAFEASTMAGFDDSPPRLPTVTAVTPAKGSTDGYDAVTVTGAHLRGALQVRFGRVAAPAFTDNGDGTVTAWSPPHPRGAVHVTVTTDQGTSTPTAPDTFRYVLSSSRAPRVTGVSPAAGPSEGGQRVTLTGSDFTGVTRVSFGRVTAGDVRVADDHTLTVVAPSGEAGPVDVSVTTPEGRSVPAAEDRYRFVPRPRVRSLSSHRGSRHGGRTVTLRGHGFRPGAVVTFGRVTAVHVAVLSRRRIDAVTPPHARARVRVRVTTLGGRAGAGRYRFR